MKFVKAVGDSFIYFITEAALVPNSIYKESAMVESNSLLLARFIHFTMTIIDSSKRIYLDLRGEAFENQKNL